jgi:outer membrane protein
MNKIIAVLFFSVFSLLSNAQEFTGEMLFKYAQEHSPKLQNSNLEVVVSEEKIKEIRSSGLPKINGELSFQNFINVPTTVVPANALNPNLASEELVGLSFGTPYNANYNLRVSQLIFSFNYIYAIKAARNYSELARLSNLQKKENLLEELKLKLGQIILIQKQQDLLKQNIKEVGALKTKTNSLIDAGVVEPTSINDIIIIELDLQNSIKLLESNEKIAFLSLKSEIGYPLDSNITLVKNFEKSSTAILDNANLNPANNLAVQMGNQNVILNDLGLKASKSEGYPSLSGFFNQQHTAMRNSFNFLDSSKDWFPATLWGINVTVPIYNSGEGRAKNKQKELALKKAKNELIDIENQIRSLYEMLKSNYNNALLNLSSQEIKVKLFDNVYSNEEKKLNYGASNSLTLSQRKMQLLKSKQELLQKQYELYKAEVHLSIHTNNLKL